MRERSKETAKLRRHFTATGYVAREDAVLLHWHRKLAMWLPPGGHVEANEDPVQAALREAREETGLEVELIEQRPGFAFQTPRQVQPPAVILIEDIDDPIDGPHQHIDSIYFLCLGAPDVDAPDGWLWVTQADLKANVPIVAPSGIPVTAAEDVRELGLAAIQACREAQSAN